jgi:hypothetical protein
MSSSLAPSIEPATDSGTGPARRHRMRIVWAAVALGAVLVVAATAAATAYLSSGLQGDGSVTYDRGGYRYVFHPVTGDEALFDLRRDPHMLRNLIGAEKERAAEMRRALEDRCGVESILELRRGCEESTRELRSLGYL